MKVIPTVRRNRERLGRKRRGGSVPFLAMWRGLYSEPWQLEPDSHVACRSTFGRSDGHPRMCHRVCWMSGHDDDQSEDWRQRTRSEPPHRAGCRSIPSHPPGICPGTPGGLIAPRSIRSGSKLKNGRPPHEMGLALANSTLLPSETAKQLVLTCVKGSCS